LYLFSYVLIYVLTCSRLALLTTGVAVFGGWVRAVKEEIGEGQDAKPGNQLES
jgi:hypothetical protein